MSYVDWIARHDMPTSEARVCLRESLRHLAHLPLISILLPVYNPHLAFLDEAIRSVRDQIYENWETCLVDDASTGSRVRPFLKTQEAADERIRLLFRERNGHISAAANSGLHDLAQSREEARYIQENPNLSLERPGFAIASPSRP